MSRPPLRPPLFPYTTLFRSDRRLPPGTVGARGIEPQRSACSGRGPRRATVIAVDDALLQDRKSTRLNSSHLVISYAVFCLKKKIGSSTGRERTTRRRYRGET